MSIVTAANLPRESSSEQFITSVDFLDAYKVKLNDPGQSVEDVYLAIFNHAPKWVSLLMGIRNKLVSLFGLDTGGNSKQKEIKALKIGEKHGVFRIIDIQSNEVIAGEDDSHLDFRVSVFKLNDYLVLSTLVHYNSNFGKLYFFIVKPFHKLVVKGMMKNASKNQRI